MSLLLADTEATNSIDPSTRVGAVVIDRSGYAVGYGHNQFAYGVMNSPERLNDRSIKYKLTVHAEIVALLMAGQNSFQSTLYCTVYPCAQCCAAAIHAGIKKIVCRAPNPRWLDDVAWVEAMCKEAGVELEVVT